VRLAVISPSSTKQHGTERVLAGLLQQLTAEHGVDVGSLSQRVAEPCGVLAESPPRSEGVGRILWRRVSSIPGRIFFNLAGGTSQIDSRVAR